MSIIQEQSNVKGCGPFPGAVRQKTSISPVQAPFPPGFCENFFRALRPCSAVRNSVFLSSAAAGRYSTPGPCHCLFLRNYNKQEYLCPSPVRLSCGSACAGPPGGRNPLLSAGTEAIPGGKAARPHLFSGRIRAPEGPFKLSCRIFRSAIKSTFLLRRSARCDKLTIYVSYPYHPESRGKEEF